MTDKVALQNGSQLTLKTEVSPPCIWVSLAITCNKTGLSYSNLIYDAAQDPDSGPRPQQTLPIRRDWQVPLHDKFIEYDAFNFLFENTNTDYSITVHFHSLQNDTANPQNDWLFDNAEARLYARHYKRVIMIPVTVAPRTRPISTVATAIWSASPIPPAGNSTARSPAWTPRSRSTRIFNSTPVRCALLTNKAAPAKGQSRSSTGC